MNFTSEDSRKMFEALHQCLALTGEEAGDLDDFAALQDRERITVEAVRTMRQELDSVQEQLRPYLDKGNGIGGYLDSLMKSKLDAEDRVKSLEEVLKKLMSWGQYTPPWADDQSVEEYGKDWARAQNVLENRD